MDKTYIIGDSQIHGKGILAKRNLKDDEVVGLGIAFKCYCIPYVTPEFGSFINHSYNPTGYLYWHDGSSQEDYDNNNTLSKDKDMGWYVRCLKPLKKGDEITVNYNHTPWYIEGPLPHYI